MQKSFIFTARNVDELPPARTGLAIYSDLVEPSLRLYVTPTGHKAYFVRKKIRGKDRRLVVGCSADSTPDHAREEARKLKHLFAAGVDPVIERDKERRAGITLGEFFKDYLERYSKVQKKSWIYDEREIPKFLGHWFDLRLSDIKRPDIRRLHEDIGRDHGLYQANRVLERLRAMYNKAIEWDWDGVNPTIGIKKYRERSRDRFIQLDEMPFFLKAISEEKNKVFHDYFWLLLLTGARKTNVIMMRWEEINWDSKFWRIPESKNGSPLVLPLVERALSILRSRKELSKSQWVFPSEADNAKHLVNSKRAWKRILQRATLHSWSTDERVAEIVKAVESRIDPDYMNLICSTVRRRAENLGLSLGKGLLDIRVHDIRRTFASYQALSGASLQVIGHSLGHKSISSTQIYSRLTLDPVRDSINKGLEKVFNCE